MHYSNQFSSPQFSNTAMSEQNLSRNTEGQGSSRLVINPVFYNENNEFEPSVDDMLYMLKRAGLINMFTTYINPYQMSMHLYRFNLFHEDKIKVNSTSKVKLWCVDWFTRIKNQYPDQWYALFVPDSDDKINPSFLPYHAPEPSPVVLTEEQINAAIARGLQKSANKRDSSFSQPA